MTKSKYILGVLAVLIGAAALFLVFYNIPMEDPENEQAREERLQRQVRELLDKGYVMVFGEYIITEVPERLDVFNISKDDVNKVIILQQDVSGAGVVDQQEGTGSQTTTAP